MDNRAQSIGIARFVLALVVGAVVYWIVDLTTDPILDGASNATTNNSANQATTWLSEWFGWMPIFLIVVSVMGLIVYSVFIRETLGR